MILKSLMLIHFFVVEISMRQLLLHNKSVCKWLLFRELTDRIRKTDFGRNKNKLTLLYSKKYYLSKKWNSKYNDECQKFKFYVLLIKYNNMIDHKNILKITRYELVHYALLLNTYDFYFVCRHIVKFFTKNPLKTACS